MNDAPPGTGRAPELRAAPGVRAGAVAAMAVAVAMASVSGCSGDASPDVESTPGDVFVIVVDTLRRDALETWDPSSPLGEAFDALAGDAIVFDDLRSGTSWTRPAVASLLTGLHARRHGVHGRRDLLPDAGPYLASTLRDAGYETFAWSANPNILPLWGFARGFDHFTDLGAEAEPEPGRTRAPKADGRVAFDRVLDALDHADTPGFHYIHVIDPHRPYRPPEAVLDEIDALGASVLGAFPVPVDRPNTKMLRDHDFRRYMGEVLDVDHALGAFVDGLKARGRYDQATILVVSDHGEEFLEHGGIDHGATLYEEVLRVPGILKRAHGADAGTRVAAPTEIADLMPTLLAAVDVAIPSDLDGRNLLADPADPSRLRFASLFLDTHRISAAYDPPYKLIVDHVTGRTTLYDLERDPGERLDLARRDPERMARMRATLDRVRARHAPGWHVRGCGCRDRDATIEFDLEVDGFQLAAFGPDGADAARGGPNAVDGAATAIGSGASGSGATRIRWQLAPGPLQHASRDELVLTPSPVRADPGALRIRIDPVDEQGLPLAIAGGRITTRHGPVDLEGGGGGRGGGGSTTEGLQHDLRSEASVDASAPVDCLGLVPARQADEAGTGDLCTPHVRVWFVPPVESREGELDADLRDRLRAIGYAE